MMLIERMESLREKKGKEEIDFENSVKKKRMREYRKQLSGKEHLLANLKAKNGMRELRRDGPLKNFHQRESNGASVKGDELFEWKLYHQKSSRNAEKWQKMRPDIVTKLNEMHRLEKQKLEAKVTEG